MTENKEGTEKDSGDRRRASLGGDYLCRGVHRGNLGGGIAGSKE